MSETLDPKTIDWDSLGFDYVKTDYRFISRWKDGEWDDGQLTKDSQITLSEAATVIHYGQHCFEGLKAYRTKDGDIQLFRPNLNAERMAESAERLLMPAFPEDKFIDAVKAVVRANHEWVPPYGSGASLYIRPFMIGAGEELGLHPASEYIFAIYCSPVGPYFKGGMTPTRFIVTEYDRAAPRGTGANKVGGNYGASLLPGEEAHAAGFSDALYLDAATHTKIEEVGAANFFAITKDNQFITPKSPSILPSITKRSLLELAEKRLGLDVAETDVYIDQIDEFVEAGAMGTAAVISPIAGVQYKGEYHPFYSETEVGPISKRLYGELYGIQNGDVEAPEGWIYPVELDH
ncbi:branched-chain amino acid aminotransferase [Aerococcus vaginalis]